MRQDKKHFKRYLSKLIKTYTIYLINKDFLILYATENKKLSQKYESLKINKLVLAFSINILNECY